MPSPPISAPRGGTLYLHHSKYNDTKLTSKSVTFVVGLKCYPCEWHAPSCHSPLARGTVAQNGTGVPVVFQSTEIVNMGA